ncbi:hypothetical protein NEUTE1DRAFT_123755 [Neurospora tetrasperma FGSC 2508]|uniref:Uncharacterized protein n=1 Tax=Neurospora tetrasperma (strain FGSC 2508 / ATCC MYA-4615 / P0657) TaxID=510951 RepID=F8MTI1_NEUT8|nr:uncharacterized protein NEUTE1DRAFT_123755 [Neurospora tetrasperma FGSC 2508]EGO55313.1 hypothetical protein NEUTE1DRAFT_123755 [Neurospora tetrasperma FGSC 2508]EGZ69464.1 hypothetical protein NEUTE2DRAFT_116032 [Neurospora tetrasperma FGSC 2509]
MQTAKAGGKAPVLSYAAALKTGLAVPEISNENNRPKSPVECSSTASSKSNADISHATQGAAGSLSSEPSKSGNSTDSLDRPSQSSQDCPPRLKPRSSALFLRGMVANCGCLYIVKTGISGFPFYRDFLESGFPMRSRCSLCNVLVTEIRFNKDVEAEVTEIIQWDEEEQDGYSEDLVEIYNDEDADDYDSSEGSQSQGEYGEDVEGGSHGGIWGDYCEDAVDEAGDTDDEGSEEEKVGVCLR